MRDYIVKRNGYIFDKRIFLLCLLLVFVLLVFSALFFGFDTKYYFFCDSSVGCDLSSFKASYCKPMSFLDHIKKPSFDSWLEKSGLCGFDRVPEGFEFGKKPVGLQGYESLITIFLVFLAFLINHFLYNKNFEFGGIK